jgi:hypothetical protein
LVFAFPITAMTRDFGDHGDSYGPLPVSLSHDPPPTDALLKTKAQPQFDSTVDRAVEAFFCVFPQFNLAQFQPCFFVFAVRSAEGRN